jgi:DNA-binding CsgD family transcriptional regulator
VRNPSCPKPRTARRPGVSSAGPRNRRGAQTAGSPAPRRDPAGDRVDSGREREVLQLTAEGYTSKETGERLHISYRTVDKHRENIRAKLGLDSTVQMAAYAHQRGIIPKQPELGGSEDEGNEGDPSASP